MKKCIPIIVLLFALPLWFSACSDTTAGGPSDAAVVDAAGSGSGSGSNSAATAGSFGYPCTAPTDRTVDATDDRLAAQIDLVEQSRHDLGGADVGAPLGSPHGQHPLEIRAGAEALAEATEHDDPGSIILSQLIEGRQQRIDGVAIKGVVDLGTI